MGVNVIPGLMCHIRGDSSPKYEVSKRIRRRHECISSRCLLSELLTYISSPSTEGRCTEGFGQEGVPSLSH